MQVFDSIRKTEYKTSVALGFFDGVHKGHVDVISKAVHRSSDDCPCVVLTFNESPHSAITGTHKPLLTTNKHKFELFEKLGVDTVFCINFNDIKDMSARQFVNEILYNKLNARSVTTGFNYHFSKGGVANADDLKRICQAQGISAYKCQPVMHHNEIVSSTKIREYIAQGDIERANQMLGYNFSINEKIVSGNHIGTKLNSPTINQQLNSMLVTPCFGVYATHVTISGTTYLGATNIGVRPTIGGNTPVCETHLLDFSAGDLYNEKAETKLLKFIRPEQKFTTIDELKAQIEKDKNVINQYFLNK